ncbi:hypothetical protein pb186bvf_003187 [Paramecium bursaria]
MQGQYIYSQLLNDPNGTIQKLLQNAKTQELDGAQNIIELMDKQFTQFENTIKTQLSNIRQKILQIKLACSQVSCGILNYLRINDFVQQIQAVRCLDNHSGTKEFQQLEELLTFISLNIEKSHQHINQQILDSQIQIIQNLQNQITKLSQESDKFFKAQIEYLKQLNKDQVPQNIQTVQNIEICPELKDFPQINDLISDGSRVEYQLIYQGTKHGLNCKAYWNHCSGQQDLLTILVSQNGNIFGGYSPCQIIKTFNSHLQDKTLKSFLFFYNKKQIFRIKKQQAHLAIFCNSSKGPTYGHFDLEIESDFNKGSSNLGQCYDISSYNIPDPKTYLFGDIKPSIKELQSLQSELQMILYLIILLNNYLNGRVRMNFINCYSSQSIIIFNILSIINFKKWKQDHEINENKFFKSNLVSQKHKEFQYVL